MLLVACAVAAAVAAPMTFEEIQRAATASKYDANGKHFLADCEGYDCLKQYVDHDDGMFSWEPLNVTISGKSLNPLSDATWTGHFVNVTSQQWLTPEDTTRSVWWHILCIIIPSNVDHDNEAFLWITGGDNEVGANVTDWLPKPTDEDILVSSYVAMDTRTVGAALFQVPNQHMIFTADPEQKHRSEDAVIAYTWYQFVLNYTTVSNVNEWPLRLPMTKAAVKALDTIEQFMGQRGKNVSSFYVVRIICMLLFS